MLSKMQDQNQNEETGHKKVHLPILGKFHRLVKRNKPLYVEAYKIIAATTEVIKVRQGANTQTDYSATAYYACLSDMLNTQISAVASNSSG